METPRWLRVGSRSMVFPRFNMRIANKLLQLCVLGACAFPSWAHEAVDVQNAGQDTRQGPRRISTRLE